MQEFIDLLREKLVEINEKPKRCKRCLMDETAEGIVFTETGCNYCDEFLKILDNPPKKINLSLEELVNKVKKDGRNKPYDCIVGLSGGVDSSYTLVKVKELGLRPLAVHMDNGWDSELAANNIKNLVENLGVDLYTHVIDWDEYRQLMQAFFDADVIDIELLYDNAMLAVCYQQANKYGLKYILAGTNSSTEGMILPRNWNWFKWDKKNIKNLAKLKRIKIKTFPAIGTLDKIYYEFVKGIKWISFLDYLPSYNKFEALEALQKQFNYKPYPYKHYESVFTRFYQGFILPVKFGVDKRKNHLSTLILTNQMKKEDAIKTLQEIPYPTEQELKDDIEYFLKKMNWTKDDLKDYLQRPEKPHKQYGSEISLWNFFKEIYKKINK
ncbi:N-acetyl sugar amidotransferase [Hippea jasoniae]|uniref:N-acetyl sugar amidotransferase n=1 Tax=Hippea jasoniae TaxID=944479 RepID=UPI0009FF2D5B|nr:N-acetyl sugar amidotransferase [Hippea jasoniae]